MENFAAQMVNFASTLWREFLYILPYLGVGVFMEAVIRTLKWHVKIRKVLTSFGVFTIPVAVILGAASPLCACATLPLVISLLVAGLPLAPAMALLVTSPLMSPAAYAMLSGMLGSGWANAVAVGAVAMGLYAGYVTLALRRYGFTEERLFRQALPAGDFHDPDYPVEQLRCECGQQLSHRVNRCNHSKFLVFLARFWEGSLKIGKFVLIGLLINVLALTFIPNQWVTALLEGEGIWPILALTFGSVPLHLPQVSAASMVFAFYFPEPGEAIALAKGVGVALLIGGPVTALPVMAIFLSMFHKRVLFLYLTLCITGTLMLAFTYRLLPFSF
jgi:uncharacterized protein